MRLPALAADRGWLLLIPEGSLDRKGNPFWAATETCCDWYGAGVDDAAFLARAIADATARHPVDPGRVVVVGHSNGGFMGYALACEGATPMTHLVSLAGSSHLDPAACAHRPPLALLQVQGDADRIQPPAGDKLAPGARAVVERWACGPLTQGGLPAGAGAGRAWSAKGCPVSLWELDGIDHYPPLEGPLGEAIADWIDRTPAPTSGP
jgi:polyhydroxybutyrate depolymerase